jgi:hypothetical protein
MVTTFGSERQWESESKTCNTTEATAALLPGIADLPPRTRRHLARAFVAERVGNQLIAAVELTQAVVAEDQETNEPEKSS